MVRRGWGRMGTVVDLEQAWRELLARLGATGDAVLETGRALLEAWSDPHRRYHSREHLCDVLDRVEELADDATDPDAVRLAAWYHDAVYEGFPDDEERSAVKAETELSALDLPAALVAEVARLIRLTVRHDPAPDDRNGAVLSDADLAALAVEPERYRANSAAIRQEYLHVPERMFRAGRAAVIEVMLTTRELFFTVTGRRRWEKTARENLARELADLRAADDDGQNRAFPWRDGAGEDKMVSVTAPDDAPITVLSEEESWDLLSGSALGRLVTTVGDQLEIFPVNFVVQNRTLLFRTAEGTKLFATVTNDQVLFEADDHGLSEGWSVIVRGHGEVLHGADEIAEADQAGLYPWLATVKLRYVRITPTQVSGRRFVFGPEPDTGQLPG